MNGLMKMPNPRFLKTAERWKNEEAPEEKPRSSKGKTKTVSTQPLNGSFPDNITESFIFSYDGPHGEYFQELIAKNNELFGGTMAEIPVGDAGEVTNIHLIKRAGLITAIYKYPQLMSHNLWPITPAQSEHLISQENLPNSRNYFEDLGLVLYDQSENGNNPQESRALYDSLRQNRQDLELTISDLEGRLIIVNPGLEKDTIMPHGVKLIVLPGITQAYAHEVLDRVGECPYFEGYGLQGGLPLIKQLGKGHRKLWMPDETQDIGLRVLFRSRGKFSHLSVGYIKLDVGNIKGLVNFAPQSAKSGGNN